MICLFCKRERDESVEHVFAAPIGPVRFTVLFVCRDCNSILGRDVDSLADRVSRLTHARHSAKLPTRGQSIESTSPVIEPDGKEIKTYFDRRLGAAVVGPQPDGDNAMLVGRDRMGETVRQMTASKFKKEGHTISDAELDVVVEKVLSQFDEASEGDVLTYEHEGAILEFDRRGIARDHAPAKRHDTPGAINRLSAKIAFELAAYVHGVEAMLHADFDRLRSWILTGEPDLSNDAIEILREPNLEGGDAAPNHTARLAEVDGVLYGEIAYYGAYVVKVRIGRAVGMQTAWAQQFQIELNGSE